MHTIPAEELGAGMTIRSDDGDFFLTRVDVAEKVSIRGVDLATGEYATRTFDRDEEVLRINQIHGEPAVPVTVAVRALEKAAERFGQDARFAALLYSEKAYFAGILAIAEAIQDAVEP